jgi:ATP-binding cassette subfamily F protein 3
MLEPELRSYLARFLFEGEEVARRVGSLSGGEQSRVALAKLMLLETNLLLLDEPTNHLDIASRDALEEVLKEYDGTLLLVSHDRYFLDKTVGRIVHIENGEVHEYLGNYSSFREKIAQREALEKERRARKKAVVKKPLRRSRRSKKKLESLEAEIAYLEKELEEIDRVLKNPELKSDWQALKSLHEQRQDLSGGLDELLSRWMEMAEENVPDENQ